MTKIIIENKKIGSLWGSIINLDALSKALAFCHHILIQVHVFPRDLDSKSFSDRLFFCFLFFFLFLFFWIKIDLMVKNQWTRVISTCLIWILNWKQKIAFNILWYLLYYFSIGTSVTHVFVYSMCLICNILHIFLFY